jgi:hypothetical protein
MSYLIDQQLTARLLADTTLNSLVAGRVNYAEPEEDIILPCMYFTQRSAEPVTSLGGNTTLSKYAYTLEIYSRTTVEATQTADAVRQTLDGWRGGQIVKSQWAGQSLTDSEDAYQVTQEYEIWADSTSAVATSDGLPRLTVQSDGLYVGGVLVGGSPDLSAYAAVNAANTFTQTQTIQSAGTTNATGARLLLSNTGSGDTLTTTIATDFNTGFVRITDGGGKTYTLGNNAIGVGTYGAVMLGSKPAIQDDSSDLLLCNYGFTGVNFFNPFTFRIDKVNGTTAVAPSASATPFTVKGFVSHTADLQQWKDSTGTTLGGITKDGNGFFGLAAPLSFSGTPAGVSGNSLAFGQSDTSSVITLGRDTNYYGWLGRPAGQYVMSWNTGTGETVFGGGAQSGAQVTIDPSEGNRIGLVVRAAASQTADIQQWQNSSGNPLFAVSAPTGTEPVVWLKGYDRDSIGFRSNGIPQLADGKPLITFGQFAQFGETNNSGGIWRNTTTQYVLFSGNTLTTDITGPRGVKILSVDAAYTPLTVQGFASQTADLQQWQDSTGSVMAAVKSDGSLYIHNRGGANTTLRLAHDANNSAVFSGWLSNTTQTIGIGFNVTGQYGGGSTGTNGRNMFVYDYVSATYRLGIGPTGVLYYGSGDSTYSVALSPSAAGSTPITAKGAEYQYADLQQWQDSTGTTLASVTAAGGLITPTVIIDSPNLAKALYFKVPIDTELYDTTGITWGREEASEGSSEILTAPRATLGYTTNPYGGGMLSIDCPSGVSINGTNVAAYVTRDADDGASVSTLQISGTLTLSHQYGETTNHLQCYNSGPTLSIDSLGGLKPATLADSAANNGTMYFSSTQSKLVYKDAGGTVRLLY